jgi:uncharacterized membrane protein YdbT with pleckstrin-like domain
MALCGYCGASLSKSLPPKEGGVETVVWKGGFSARAVAHHWFGYGLYVAAAVVGWVYLPEDWKKFEYAGYVALGAALLPLLAILFNLFKQKLYYHYALTDDTLYVYRGILIRHKDTTPLYRIDDLSVIQSLANRIFRVGSIYIHAPTDQSDDKLLIRGIVDPHGVEKQIRDLVRRHKRGSIRMEEI